MEVSPELPEFLLDRQETDDNDTVDGCPVEQAMSITNGSSTATASRTSTVATFGCLLFFGLIWTVCVLGFDGVTLWARFGKSARRDFQKLPAS